MHRCPSGRNAMLDMCLTVLMGGGGRLCVGDRAGSANPSIVQTWAGTGRVDISVQLLVSLTLYIIREPLRRGLATLPFQRVQEKQWGKKDKLSRGGRGYRMAVLTE